MFSTLSITFLFGGEKERRGGGEGRGGERRGEEREKVDGEEIKRGEEKEKRDISEVSGRRSKVYVSRIRSEGGLGRREGCGRM